MVAAYADAAYTQSVLTWWRPANVVYERADTVMFAGQGSPDAPRCGFSALVVSTLRGMAVPFGHFDILEDQAVREGMKVRRCCASVPDIPVGKLNLTINDMQLLCQHVVL